VYGRYGHRQWAAPWPTTRIVVKDPFAVMSLAAVVAATAAVPVLVYRHPAAVLTSYRRMGWLPDVAEVSAVVSGRVDVTPAPEGVAEDDVRAMAWFWSTLNSVALSDLTTVETAVVVSHEELAAGGRDALRVLFDACDVAWSADEARESTRTPVEPSLSRSHAEVSEKVLHRLDRPSDEVANAWRSHIEDRELDVLGELAGPTFAALQAARLPVT
jgi:hypothetical protein